MEAMHKSVEGLSTKADWVLIDGNRIPSRSRIARRRSSRVMRRACIAAASVLAKVTRDRMMVEIAENIRNTGSQSIRVRHQVARTRFTSTVRARIIA